MTISNAYSFKSRGTVYGPYDLTKLPADIVLRLAEHGFKQKMSDALADPKIVGHEDGTLVRIWDNLVAGEWRKPTDRKPALSPLDSIIWDLMEKVVRAKVMTASGLKKVKELTADHLDMIGEKTEEAFGKADIRERFVAAAQKELDARTAATALTFEL